MFEAVQKQSVSDVVFNQLRDRIVSQQLKPGEELPAERALCELLDVSRNAVREALKRLQQAGLVRVRHGGTTTVSDYRAQAGPELLASLMIDAAGRIQVGVARSVVRMRQVLSPEIAADAATHGSPAMADRLDAIVKQMREASGPAELQPLALEFWDVLVDGSGNIAYRLAFNSLRKTYEPIARLMTGMLADEFSRLDSFSSMARHVRSGEREAAFDVARDYIDSSSQAINRFLTLYEQHLEGI